MTTHSFGLDARTWLTIGEAALYLKRKPSAVRALIAKGKLTPDGRGPRGCAMFRVGTLDRFLEAGVRRDESFGCPNPHCPWQNDETP